jgi:hypothetical protein
MKHNRMKDELENIAQQSIPGDTNLWPKISAKIERNSSTMFSRFRPLTAALMAVLVLLLLSGVAYAIGRTLGYIPGVGMVDNSAGVRMLAKPVTETRKGVTLTISSVMVYEDRVEMIYDVSGIAPENDAARSNDSTAAPTDFCGGVEMGEPPSEEGNARLELPDGTILERDRTNKYSQNVFAMKPVYVAAVPTDVTSMTFLLDCIPFARRGAMPENWSVPINLISVPVGTVVGVPVIEVESQPEEPVNELVELPIETVAAVVPPKVTMTLTKIVPLDTMTVFYFRMDVEDKDPSLISVMPLKVSVIDSAGQKIHLIGNFTWQPFEHQVGSEFEFTSQSKPASGPLTLIVENATAYFMPLYVDPPQATADEMSFHFDAGENPQYGQTWELNQEIKVADYAIRFTSVRAANFEDIRTPEFIDGSQGYEFGYDFSVETDAPIKIQVQMDITSEAFNCGLTNSNSYAPESSSFHYIQLCQGGYPAGNVRVTLREVSVLVENTWQEVWNP